MLYIPGYVVAELNKLSISQTPTMVKHELEATHVANILALRGFHLVRDLG